MIFYRLHAQRRQLIYGGGLVGDEIIVTHDPYAVLSCAEAIRDDAPATDLVVQVLVAEDSESIEDAYCHESHTIEEFEALCLP